MICNCDCLGFYIFPFQKITCTENIFYYSKKKKMQYHCCILKKIDILQATLK